MITGRWVFISFVVSAMLGAPALAMADETLKAKLRGFEETPAISTTGNGRFRGEISDDETSINFKLSYSDLEGGNVLFAHIHLGQRSVAGGVSVFLCGGGGKPACPPSPATVTGTIDASNVIGPKPQGIAEEGSSATEEFKELLRAIRKGVTYVNVHTVVFPAGEIRGQIREE